MADADAVERRDRHRALATMPKYKGDEPWRIHEMEFESWRILMDIVNVEFLKGALFYSIRGRASERVRHLGGGSPEFTGSATFKDYLAKIREVFEPASESALAK